MDAIPRYNHLHIGLLSFLDADRPHDETRRLVHRDEFVSGCGFLIVSSGDIGPHRVHERLLLTPPRLDSGSDNEFILTLEDKVTR